MGLSSLPPWDLSFWTDYSVKDLRQAYWSVPVLLDWDSSCVTIPKKQGSDAQVWLHPYGSWFDHPSLWFSRIVCVCVWGGGGGGGVELSL